MSFQQINPTGCKKCGGRRWEYTDYCRTEHEEIVEHRCLEVDCGYQELTYGDEFHTYSKTPEEVRKFIKEYELEEELEQVKEGRQMAVSTDPTYLKALNEAVQSADPKLLERFFFMEKTINEIFRNPFKRISEGWSDVRIGCYLLGNEQLDNQLFPKHPSGKTKLDRTNPNVVRFIDKAEKWLEETGKCLIDGQVKAAQPKGFGGAN